jgi:hypothetical protein
VQIISQLIKSIQQLLQYSPTKSLKHWIRCSSTVNILLHVNLDRCTRYKMPDLKRDSSYMIFKCQIKKLCISWSSASEQKFSAISRSPNRKKSNFLFSAAIVQEILL